MEKYDTILLVHMEKMNVFRKFLDVFETKGFQIIQVEGIERAYQILGSHSVDIIVLDMDVGYDKAFKFCYHVKHNKNLKNIFLIGLTDAHERFGIYLNARTNEEKKWLNVDLLVHKPISVKNIYRMLKREIAILEGMDATELDSIVDYWGYNQ